MSKTGISPEKPRGSSSKSPATSEVLPLTLREFEKLGKKNMTKQAIEYYRNGSMEEHTLQWNLDGFNKFYLRPQYMLRDVSVRDSSAYFFKIKCSFPVAVAPSAFHKLAHEMGETATAQACEEEGIIYTMSTMSTVSIEEVAQKAPKGNKFFQLYVYKDRSITEKLLQRAEAAGFKAVVWTVDTPFIGNRLGEKRVGFHLPENLQMANFKDDVLRKQGTMGHQLNNESALHKFTEEMLDPSLTWKDVKWLKSVTKMPIIAKGVLTREDAIRAVEGGIDGIIVSNHGGRQLDFVASTIESLPEVVEAVGGKVPVWVDGGFRRGTDVLMALALGAKGVFLARPILWALAYKGKEGVKMCIRMLKKEFDVALALSGCRSVKDITPNIVARRETLYHPK